MNDFHSNKPHYRWNITVFWRSTWYSILSAHSCLLGVTFHLCHRSFFSLMGLHWSLGWGEGLHNDCRREDSLILSLLCSLPSILTLQILRVSWQLVGLCFYITWCVGRFEKTRTFCAEGPVPLGAHGTISLCLKEPLLSKTRKLSLCSEVPCLSLCPSPGQGNSHLHTPLLQVPVLLLSNPFLLSEFKVKETQTRKSSRLPVLQAAAR